VSGNYGYGLTLGVLISANTGNLGSIIDTENHWIGLIPAGIESIAIGDYVVADTTGTIASLTLGGGEAINQPAQTSFGMYLQGSPGSLTITNLTVLPTSFVGLSNGNYAEVGTLTITNRIPVPLTTGQAQVGLPSTQYGQFQINNTADSPNFLSFAANFNPGAGQKSITWRNGSAIMGQIDVRYPAPYAEFCIGHLYNSGYSTTDSMCVDGAGNVYGPTGAIYIPSAALAYQQVNSGLHPVFAPTIPGIGADLMTGPATSTTGDFVKFGDTVGTQADAGLAVTAVPQKVNTCGTTSTCSNTSQSSPRIVWGTVALSGGTVTVGSMTAWTSASTFGCTCTDTSTTATSCTVQNTSSSSITIKGTSTDTVTYMCVGN